MCTSADASFLRAADVKVTADLAHINRLAFVDKERIAGHYGEIRKRRQHADDVFVDAVAQVAQAQQRLKLQSGLTSRFADVVQDCSLREGSWSQGICLANIAKRNFSRPCLFWSLAIPVQ